MESLDCCHECCIKADLCDELIEELKKLTKHRVDANPWTSVPSIASHLAKEILDKHGVKCD